MIKFLFKILLNSISEMIKQYQVNSQLFIQSINKFLQEPHLQHGGHLNDIKFQSTSLTFLHQLSPQRQLFFPLDHLCLLLWCGTQHLSPSPNKSRADGLCWATAK